LNIKNATDLHEPPRLSGASRYLRHRRGRCASRYCWPVENLFQPRTHTDKSL